MARRGSFHSPGRRLPRVSATELTLVTGERYAIDGEPADVEKAILAAARGSLMQLAWLAEAESGPRAGGQPGARRLAQRARARRRLRARGRSSRAGELASRAIAVGGPLAGVLGLPFSYFSLGGDEACRFDPASP